MMHLSTRFLPLFGLPLITVFAVSCAQPGAGDGVLPTSPSSLSVGPSAAALGPGASYDPTGTWRFVTTDIHGNVEDSFDTDVSQDGDGNLHFADEDGPITLERLGTGVIITYRLSLTSVESGCDAVRVRGLARLDTRTNTMTVNIRLKGCSNTREGRLGFVVTGTKLS